MIISYKETSSKNLDAERKHVSSYDETMYTCIPFSIAFRIIALLDGRCKPCSDNICFSKNSRRLFIVTHYFEKRRRYHITSRYCLLQPRNLPSQTLNSLPTVNTLNEKSVVRWFAGNIVVWLIPPIRYPHILLFRLQIDRRPKYFSSLDVWAQSSRHQHPSIASVWRADANIKRKQRFVFLAWYYYAIPRWNVGW